MSSTVLTFVDFFWIWFIAAVLNGGTTCLQKDGTVAKTLWARSGARWRP